jgi:hypothetical protein
MGESGWWSKTSLALDDTLQEALCSPHLSCPICATCPDIDIYPRSLLRCFARSVWFICHVVLAVWCARLGEQWAAHIRTRWIACSEDEKSACSATSRCVHAATRLARPVILASAVVVVSALITAAVAVTSTRYTDPEFRALAVWFKSFVHALKTDLARAKTMALNVVDSRTQKDTSLPTQS